MDRVDERPVLVADLAAQALVRLGLQGGRVYHLVPGIRRLGILQARALRGLPAFGRGAPAGPGRQRGPRAGAVAVPVPMWVTGPAPAIGPAAAAIPGHRAKAAVQLRNGGSSRQKLKARLGASAARLPRLRASDSDASGWRPATGRPRAARRADTCDPLPPGPAPRLRPRSPRGVARWARAPWGRVASGHTTSRAEGTALNSHKTDHLSRVSGKSPVQVGRPCFLYG